MGFVVEVMVAAMTCGLTRMSRLASRKGKENIDNWRSSGLLPNWLDSGGSGLCSMC
jgi:hypothetical protein